MSFGSYRDAIEILHKAVEDLHAEGQENPYAQKNHMMILGIGFAVGRLMRAEEEAIRQFEKDSEGSFVVDLSSK